MGALKRQELTATHGHSHTPAAAAAAHTSAEGTLTKCHKKKNLIF